MNSPEFFAARACFTVAFGSLGIMTAVWLLSADPPVWARVIVGTFAGVALFAALPELLRWVSYREALSAPAKAPQQAAAAQDRSFPWVYASAVMGDDGKVQAIRAAFGAHGTGRQHNVKYDFTALTEDKPMKVPPSGIVAAMIDPGSFTTKWELDPGKYFILMRSDEGAFRESLSVEILPDSTLHQEIRILDEKDRVIFEQEMPEVPPATAPTNAAASRTMPSQAQGGKGAESHGVKAGDGGAGYSGGGGGAVGQAYVLPGGGIVFPGAGGGGGGAGPGGIGGAGGSVNVTLPPGARWATNEEIDKARAETRSALYEAANARVERQRHDMIVSIAQDWVSSHDSVPTTQAGILDAATDYIDDELKRRGETWVFDRETRRALGFPPAIGDSYAPK